MISEERLRKGFEKVYKTKELKFGQIVNIKARLKRVKHSYNKVCWIKEHEMILSGVKSNLSEPKAYTNAVYLGSRTLFNGKRNYDSESGWYFHKEEHFTAHLVCIEGRNPFYVLEEDIIV